MSIMVERDALVVLDGDEIVAVAGYDGYAEADESGAWEAELAILVEDGWQRRGIGRQLARRLVVLARERGYDTFVARMLPDNPAALGLIRKVFPEATIRYTGDDYEARFPLSA